MTVKFLKNILKIYLLTGSLILGLWSCSGMNSSDKTSEEESVKKAPIADNEDPLTPLNKDNYLLQGQCDSSILEDIHVKATDPIVSETTTCDTEGTFTVTLDLSEVTDSGALSLSLSYGSMEPATVDIVACLGSGDSATDPKIICTYEQLKDMKNDMETVSGEDLLQKYYALGMNIDAQASWGEGPDVDDGNGNNVSCTSYDGNQSTEIISSHCAGWETLPILVGGFDGQGYEINNLYKHDEADYSGLFSQIQENAQVSNLHLRNVRAHNTSDTSGASSGGIFGLLSDNGVINNSSVYGKITCNKACGGLGGNLEYGFLYNSYTNVEVIGQFAGGLVGTTGGDIVSSYSKGSVEAKGIYSFAGGLLGFSEGGAVYYSYSEASVHGENNASSFSADFEEGNSYNSYGVGGVTADDTFGGFSAELGSSDTFGSNNFWDTESTRQSSSATSSDFSAVGLTTAEMQSSCLEGSSQAICALNSLGEGFVFQSGQYPKVKKCIECDPSGTLTFSNELVGGQSNNL